MKHKSAWCVVLAVCAVALVAAQEPRTAIDFNRLAVEAFQKQDQAAYLQHSRKAHELWPNHPRLMFHLARAQALSGNRAEALQWLERAAQLAGDVDVNDAAFAALQDAPQMAAIRQHLEEWKRPRSASSVAFRLEERDLIPENVAWDPATQTFFIGAIYKRKIVARDRAGKVRDFVASKQDGLGGVLGMKLDLKRRRLWAVSYNGPNPPVMDAPPDEHLRGVFIFDLNTGKLVRKVTSFADGEPLSANDVVLDSQGNAYLSSCRRGAVCRVGAEDATAEVFLPSEAIGFVNGIAISDDDRYLFVAHGNGVERVEIATHAHITLAHAPGISLSGADGLSFYKGSLVAVQNGLQPERVARYWLSRDMSRVERAEILEVNNPHFIIPTTGCIAGETFYYMANSNLRAFQEGKILPWENLVEPVILQIRLE